MIEFVDDYYLVVTAIITVGWQFFFALIATLSKSDKVTDLVRIAFNICDI
jgi:hypothetical protein